MAIHLASVISAAFLAYLLYMYMGIFILLSNRVLLVHINLPLGILLILEETWQES